MIIIKCFNDYLYINKVHASSCFLIRSYDQYGGIDFFNMLYDIKNQVRVHIKYD
jgi:hypothetical protein